MLEETVNHANNVLVTFDSIIDTDIGLLKFMKDNFNNPSFSYISNFEDIKALKPLLVERENKNPLSVILKDEYFENMESLYNEFIEKHYKDIVLYSEPTDIIKAVKVFLLSKGVIKVTVICKNEYEEQYIIKQNIKGLSTVIKDYDEISLSQYDTLIVKNIYDLLSFRKVEGKNLMICNYKFNLDKENADNLIPLLEVAGLYMDSNVIHIIDVYDKEELEKICG